MEREDGRIRESPLTPSLRGGMERIPGRSEFVDAPKRGGWLDMAGIERSVLSRRCLDRQIPDGNTLQLDVAAGEHARNASAVEVVREFTTADARIKLDQLCPARGGRRTHLAGQTDIGQRR